MAVLDTTKAIRKILLGVSAVTDVLGSSPFRFFPDKLPQSAGDDTALSFPAATIQEGAGESAQAFDGGTGHVAPSVLIEVYAATRSAANSSRELIRQALNAYRGTVTVSGESVFIHQIHCRRSPNTHDDAPSKNDFDTLYISPLECDVVQEEAAT